ncbi:MAG: BBP7 family outer membrane beta-barrel protein [Pirellulales bacterium]
MSTSSRTVNGLVLAVLACWSVASVAAGQSYESRGAFGSNAYGAGLNEGRGAELRRQEITRVPQPDPDDSIASPSDRMVYGTPTPGPAVLSATEEPYDVPCCTLCSCVYGSVEFLYLHRAAASGATSLIEDANSGAPLLTGDALSFGYQPGMRALVGLRGSDLGGVEFGYFGYFDHSATTSVSAADYPGATLALPGALGGASNVFFGLTDAAFDYSSAINSYEINWTCCCCDTRTNCCGRTLGYSIEWLAGLRYLTLDEQLQINGRRFETVDYETGYYHIDARNDLYGVQTGLRSRVCRGRWAAEGVAKAGLFANQAGQTQTVIDYPNFPLRPTVGDSGTSMAFVGELGFTAIYQLNHTWGLRAGYDLIWLQGVALAPSQLDYSFTPESGTSYERGDGLFLHGFRFGVEARW